MSNIQFTQIQKPSSGLSLMVKAVIGSKLGGNVVPKIGIKGSLGKVEKTEAMPWLKICDYDTTSEEVPSMYLHILGHLYHMELLTKKEFPYKLLGTIHTSSKIKKYDSIKFGDDLDIEVFFGDTVPHEKGVLVNLNQKLYRKGELVWQEEMFFLKKTSSSQVKSEPKEKKTSEPISGTSEFWKLNTDLGRRHGMISGDINPIHLHSIPAKLFGFKKHIAHGVWTVGRAMATLEQKFSAPYEFECAFKLPVFLPTKVQFNYAEEGDFIPFEVRDKNNEKPHMSGSIKNL